MGTLAGLMVLECGWKGSAATAGLLLCLGFVQASWRPARGSRKAPRASGSGRGGPVRALRTTGVHGTPPYGGVGVTGRQPPGHCGTYG